MQQKNAIFRKYKSITTAHHDRVKSIISSRTNPDEEWIATEKVHGANFSFIYDAEENKIFPARRNAIILEGEKFFGYKTVFERYKDNVIQLFETLQKQYSNILRLYLYGELFGGKYGDREISLRTPEQEKARLEPDYPTLDYMGPVQTEVDYCPDYDFYAFDIVIVVSQQDDDTEKQYKSEREITIDCDTAIQLFQSCKFPVYAKVLFRGTLEECLALEPEFQTTIPNTFYDLPPIEDNESEGYVLRPVYPRYYNYNQSVIIKLKTQRFREIIPDLYQQKTELLREASKTNIVIDDDARNIEGKKNKRKNPENHTLEDIHIFIKTLPDPIKTLMEHLYGYITTNRLDNVLSKSGVDHLVYCEDLGRKLRAILSPYYYNRSNRYSHLSDNVDPNTLPLVLNSKSKIQLAISLAKDAWHDFYRDYRYDLETLSNEKKKYLGIMKRINTALSHMTIDQHPINYREKHK